MRPVSPPPGLFQGKNIMTPNILGFYKLGKGVYAELSTGRGLRNQPIFGVTVRPDYSARSRLFQSEAAALDYIRELANTKEDA